MNLLSFMKKKEEKEKVDEKTKGEKKIVKMIRLDTETNPIAGKKSKGQTRAYKDQTGERQEKTEKIERCATVGPCSESNVTIGRSSKTALQIKQLLQTLWSLKNKLESQYDQLLNGKIKPQKYQQIIRLLSMNFFRFRITSLVTALDEYSNVIQGLQLLISKLTNNEKLSEHILIRNQEDFVLFFKFFFSKPYTLINLPAVRKIIKLLWDQFTFTSLTQTAILNNLKLWIFGISAPLNPSMNRLHQHCCQKSQQVSRMVNHRSNSHVYISINDSDALGLTSLMVAVVTKNIKAIQKLIKNGADINVCPLTINQKIVTQSKEESTKYGLKILLRKQFGIKERRQPNIMEILRFQKRIDQIAQILCWRSNYEMKKLRKDKQISDFLQLFPDCTFQIDWKQYRGMLCFKSLPKDIISVYKCGYSLNIDFHISDLQKQNGKQQEHYSLIFKAEPKQQSKLFLISHGERIIRNLIQDQDLMVIKQKYNNILKHGNIYNPDFTDFKSIFYPKDNHFTATFQTYYQNLVKFNIHNFKSQKEYLREVLNSDLIDYKQLQKNELQSILNQTVANPQKIKYKNITSTGSVDIQWSKQDLNLTHLQFILKLASLTFPSSLLLNKIQCCLKLFQDPLLMPHNFRKQLPVMCKFSADGEINIQSQIKNINYCTLDQSVFRVEVRAKQMEYQQIGEPINLSHLQDTVFMDELYSISASRFLGKSQKIIQFQQEEANKKFEQLLNYSDLWNHDEEEEK